MTEEQKDDTPPIVIDIASLKTEKEIEKLQIEIEKSKNENAELIKKWWKKPQYIFALIAAFSPLIIGILTVCIAYFSGFLQAQSKLNEIQKITFENNKKEINNHIDSLNAEVTRGNLLNIAIRKSTDSLISLLEISKKQLEKFRNDNKSISGQVFSLIDKLAIADSKNKDLNQTIIDLNQAIEENKKAMKELRDLQFISKLKHSQELENAMDKYHEETQKLKAEIKRLKGL